MHDRHGLQLKRVVIQASVLALWLIAPFGAQASILGTSGPFRMLGGVTCPIGSANGCVPPPVDNNLPPSQQVMRHVERALTLLDLLRVAEAKAALDDALRLDPDNVQALTLRGRLALTEGSPDTARPDIERAFRLAPSNMNLLATLAALSPSDQALKDLNTVLSVQPDDTDSLFARAVILLRNHDLTPALTDLNHSLAAAPDDPRAQILRAQVNLQRQSYDLAALDAQKLLSANPRNRQALQIVAAARVGAGDEAGAIESYTAILDGTDLTKLTPSPDLNAALVERGRLYAKRRRFDEAKRDLQVLMSLRGIQETLMLQIYLRGHGYPNVEITGHPTPVFDTALDACFSNTVCGPNLFR